VIYVIMAISAPILDKLGVIQPQTFHSDLVGGIGAVPKTSFGGISWDHLLGIEPQTGRDLLSRLVLGVTLSMTVATLATAFSIIVGTVVGIISGYLGGRADFWIGRFIDLVLSFPQLLMLLALSPVLIDRIVAIGVPSGNPANLVYLVAVLGFFGFPYFARIIRGQVLSLREREFVEAARALGSSDRLILRRHLLPHLLAPVVVAWSLDVGAKILATAGLSFLGLGTQPPTADWGSMLATARTFVILSPHVALLPGLAIFLVVLSLNVLGDALQDYLDPRMRHG
jgi:peptide/nickel transport system permease protein